jgi:hypothetical protein
MCQEKGRLTPHLQTGKLDAMQLCYGIRGTQSCRGSQPARIMTSHRPPASFQTHPFMSQKIILIVFGLLLVSVSQFASGGINPNDSTRYPASLSEGIDFSRPGYPDFIADVSGLSAYENTYRWTDANAGPAARFKFKAPLPEHFVLEIEAEAFGPNGNLPTVIKLGNTSASIYFRVDDNKPHFQEFSNPDRVDLIEIIPPSPVSPKDYEHFSNDTRKLGLAMKRIAIHSPLEFKVLMLSQNLQSNAVYWWVRAQESIQNLQLERVKIIVYDYVQRARRWLRE